MRAPRHKFTAVATALVVLVAHVLCLCRSAQAAEAQVDPEPAAHRCCTHEPQPSAPAPHDPAHDADGHCRHCDGPAAATAAPSTGDPGTPWHLPAFQFVASPAVDAGCFAALDRAPAAFGISGVAFVSPPTLLRLGCALNL